MDPTISNKARVAFSSIERMLSWITTRTLSVSPEEQEHLVTLGFNPRRIEVIPNGVTPPPLPSRDEARKSLGLPATAPVIGFIGRFSHQKGVDLLVEAFAEVVKHQPDALLSLIGFGELEPSLKKLAQDLGIARSVRWLGQQPGLASMPAFDVFALPSRYEGLPYVLVEALAAGAPLVVSDHTGSRLLVEPGVNGLRVAAGEVEPLADAIRALLNDPARQASFSAESRERSRQFTVETMVDRIHGVYLAHARRRTV